MLEGAAQGAGGVGPIPGGVQGATGHGTLLWAGEKVGLGLRLDSMVSGVFSNLSDSVKSGQIPCAGLEVLCQKSKPSSLCNTPSCSPS